MPKRRDVRDAIERGSASAAEAARAAVRKAVEITGPYATQAADAGREIVQAAGTRAKSALYPEDATGILNANEFFQPFPENLPSPEFLSISWRSDVLLGLSAAGVFAFEDSIIGTTRRVFHDDLRHQELSTRLFGADYDAIHRWMDTVPGSGVRGGGILHRLQHGHDLDGARLIYSEHGLPGLLVWAQHIIQDSATPTGVPLPVGGQGLASFLVDKGVASPGKAALMLSFNVAEVAAGFLTGAFALRLARLVRDLQKRRQVKRLCQRAAKAWNTGDLDSVIAHYEAARAEADGDPGIELALGWAYAEMDRPKAQSFLAFRAAAEGLARTDAKVETQGLCLDLRGLAYLLALSQSTEVLGQQDLQTSWRGELNRMLRGALYAFERTARDFHERPSFAIAGREVEWRPRPLAAGANYYIGARLAHGSPFLPSASSAERLGNLALAQLDRARALYPDEADRIGCVADRWRLERAPVHVPAPRPA